MKEISSAAHPLVKYWVRLRSDAAFRRKEKRLLVEGLKCIQDVASKLPIKRLISLDEMPTFLCDEAIIVTHTILEKISGLETSDGLIAEFEMPAAQNLKGLSHILVCDRIQDPGNIGTLIRTALSLGWEGIFFLPGCADPFNDKALRAAKSAT